MPKVSIILTSFNHANYLREAIDSALNQTFTDFELIIWDDASQDDSWEIICSYQDARIRAFRNDETRRAVYGINKAISEVAKGKYVAIHHSDDVWEPGKLERQVAFLDEAQNFGAVFTWLKVVDEHGDEHLDGWSCQENRTQWKWLNLFFFMRNHLAHPSVLIRKRCYQEVGLYRFGLAQSCDAEMWSRLLLKFPVHVIEEKLTKHRRFSDDSSASGNRPDVSIRLVNEWNVLRKNFLSIDCFDDLVAIFPTLEAYRRHQGFNTKFLLAMVCLSGKADRPAWQLGISWMYDLLGDPVQAIEINRLYSFTYKDMVKITTEFDPYALSAVSERDAAVSERDAAVSERDAAVSERDAAVSERDAAVSERDAAVSERDAAVSERDAAVSERDAAVSELYMVYRSKSWRVTEPLRFVMSTGKSLGQILPRLFHFGPKLLNYRRLNSGLRLLSQGDLKGLRSAFSYLLRDETRRLITQKNAECILPSPLDIGQPLVSVVIPCFNYGKFVVSAIDSVLAQTLADVEIIVVDGGSTDNETLEILSAIQRPRTRILFRDGRHLVGDNRNYGIERARGRYICCLDADDTLDATYLEKAVFYLETYGYDVVSTAIKFVGARDGHLGIVERPDLTDMVNGNHVLTCALFRKQLWEAVGGYIDVGIGKHHVAEDWDFWIRLAANGARIRNISGEYLFNYRVHEGGSLSSSADVRSLSEQRKVILDRNRDVLTPTAYKFSEDQQSRYLRCEPTKTALASCFDIDTHRMTVLLAMPYCLVGGAERLLSGFCEYLVTHGWRIIVITTLPPEPSQGTSIDWFKLSTSEVFSLPSFLAPEERADFAAYLLASRRVDCLLNTGSRLVYELIPSLKKNNPHLSIVDFLFNTVGHVESHLEFKRFLSFALAENQEVFDWYVNVAGWPVERLARVTSGVDLKRFSPKGRPKALVEKYCIDASELVVGFSGRLSEEKAPDIFVEVANLCREFGNVRFVMTGAGPLTKSMLDKVRALPRESRFEFAGLVDDVDQYLALYDVLVLPSRFDGRPLVVMEALACGVPTIASNVGGLSDMISDGINGYLVPPADAREIADRIIRMAENRPLLATLKEGARKLAEEKLDANLAYRDFEAALCMAIDSHIGAD